MNIDKPSRLCIIKDVYKKEPFNLNEHQIKCFLAVRKYLNFSTAAKQMYITQPALTYQINRLERELGVKLFDRTTSSVNLTKAGCAFATQAEKLNQQFLETAGVMREFAGIQKKIILALPRLMMTHDEIYKTLMSRIIEAFPEHDIEVLPSTTGTGTYASLSGGIDCIIGMMPSSEEDGVAYYPLFQPKYFIIVDPQHVLANRNTIRPTELADQTLYYESGEQLLAERLRHVLEPKGIKLSFKKVSTYDTVYPLLLGGKGIFLSPVIHRGFPQHYFIPLQTDDNLPATVLMCLKDPCNPIIPKLKELILQVYQENFPKAMVGSQV